MPYGLSIGPVALEGKAKVDLEKAVRIWGLDRDALHERTRAIWAAGFRPNRGIDEPVGSGFDTADQES